MGKLWWRPEGKSLMTNYKPPFRAVEPVSCIQCSIRRMALFKPLAGDKTLNAAEHFRSGQVSLPVKTHLYRQGDAYVDSYTLFDGWVMLYRTLKSGKRQILRFALPGDFLNFQPDVFGERTHSAVTLTDCTLCSFDGQHLLEMFRTYPELSLQLAWINARDMTLSEEYLANVARRSARERIVFLILDIYDRLRARGLNRSDEIPFPVTQEDIADMVGLTVVHVNRTLGVLRRDGLLEVDRRHLRIPNYQALKEIAGYDENTVHPRPFL